MAENTTIQKSLLASRLNQAIQPISYEISIEPDLVNASFSGTQSIKLEAKESFSELSLNTAEITVSSALICTPEGKQYEAEITTDEESQRSTFKLAQQLSSGTYELKLQFTGILNNKLRGFYRSTYKDESGSERLIATTKFEPSDARRAFPCFDEPAFKATFQINLIVDKAYNAIANTKLLSEQLLDNGKKLLRFAPSIRMSSYLVAYMVGEFVSSQPALSNGTEIRIWTVPGKQHMCQFALDWAKASLDYFAEYFKTNYPGDKLDLIAIPDFASGAMENFGAITFRETALLVDQARATLPEKKRVAEVICHENAHMWFGDLVTMSWWNGLWLNEAFATFMAAKAVDKLMPEWKFWESFNIEKAGAMRIDGLHASRPIEFPVATPEDARAMFDVLTYEKGCAILRMLELYIGEEVFRQGCATYMKRHAFANTETADLWLSLQSAVDDAKLAIPVSAMMDTWVFQQGYPLIHADICPEGLSLKQQPFRYLQQESPNEALWYVPIWIRTVGDTSNPEICEALNEKSLSLNKVCSDTIIVNAGGKGFYRVSYGKNLLKNLMARLADMTAAERFNLLADTWASTLAGETRVDTYLDTLKLMLKTETDANVFSIALSSIAHLRRIVRVACPAEVQLAYKDFVSNNLLPVLDRISWEARSEEPEQNAELRTSVFSTLGIIGDEKTVEKARALWQKYLADASSVPANLLPAIVDTVSTHGDEALYQTFVELRSSAKTPQEEARFLFALPNFSDTKLIERTLKASLDGTIRVQDAPQILRALLYNKAGGTQSWEFVKANWDKIVSALPLQGVIRLCDGLTALVDPKLESDIVAFAPRLRIKGNEKALAQNLESLSIANGFVSREANTLSAYLS